MEYNELRKKLKRFGYTRKTDRLSELSNKTVIRRNFADKSLNRTYLSNSPVMGTNFNNAAMTGSYFNNCQFHNCHMYMSDLEYCEFYKCFFTSKHTIVSSFNESNFLESIFEDVSFSSCAFSGSFFEKCTFRNVKIEFTTFENSLFKNCTFENMDMKILNLDFIEFENPKMDNVMLPLEQITHSIGLLEYCIYTTDNILIGSDSNVVLSKEEYYKLQTIIRKRNLPTIHELDISSLSKIVKSDFDIVYLSNIIECMICRELDKYPFGACENLVEQEVIKKTLKEVMPLLRDDGTVLVDYRSNTNRIYSTDYLFCNDFFDVTEFESKFPPDVSLGKYAHTDLALTYKPKRKGNILDHL